MRQAKSGATFISIPHDQELIPGVKEAITRYPNHLLIGITNQGGVAAGKKSLEDAIEEQKYTIKLVPRLYYIYFCPDFEGKQCYRVVDVDGVIRCAAINFEYGDDLQQWQGLCRKPNHGMIEIAIAEHSLKVNRQESLFVGDRPEDQAAALAANIPFMWANQWRN